MYPDPNAGVCERLEEMLCTKGTAVGAKATAEASEPPNARVRPDIRIFVGG